MHPVLLAAVLAAPQMQAEAPAFPPLESRRIECIIAVLPTIDVVPLPPPKPKTKKEIINELFPSDIVEELRYESYADLDRAFEAGQLVDIHDDPVSLGIRIRTTGRFPIAEKEKDPKKKQKLLRLSVEAAGLLVAVAERFRRDAAENWLPFDLTSMVRPWEYQKRLMRTNANADTRAQGIPPTHTFGHAFDIGRATLSPKLDRILESVLKAMETDGLLVYFKEGKAQAAYHVIVHPSAAESLSATYWAYAMRLQLALNSTR